MYRALLNLMLGYFPHFLEEITQTFIDQQRRYGSYAEARWEWADEELRVLLISILVQGSKAESKPIVLFIDALDECGADLAEQLLSELLDIMEAAEHEESPVKICISSRYYPVLDVESIPTIPVQSSNHDDIRSVVENRLKYIHPQSRRNQIRDTILMKAKGGFQWATLVTNQAVKDDKIGKTLDELRGRIESLPEDLNQLYASVLTSSDEAEQHQMVKLFQWVLFAERPLSTLELRDALASDKSMAFTTVAELRSHQNWKETLPQFEQHVKHLSRGLVEFQARNLDERYNQHAGKSDREALLVHQSIADYLFRRFLQNTQHEQDHSLSIVGAVQFEISRSCLRYMALREVQEAVRHPHSISSAEFSLLPYALQYVFLHIRKVEQKEPSQPDLLQLMHWVVDVEGWPMIGSTATDILVALSSQSALEAILRSKADKRNIYGWTPLSRAVRDGQDTIVKMLLDTQQVDVNAKNVDGWTPLSREASNAHDAMVKMLLETPNIEVNARDGNGWTPLSRAAANGHDTIVKMLLDVQKVDLDDKDSNGWTPLSLAVANKHERVVKMLLNTRKVNINTRDRYGWTPLSRALANRHVAITKMLFDQCV